MWVLRFLVVTDPSERGHPVFKRQVLVILTAILGVLVGVAPVAEAQADTNYRPPATKTAPKPAPKKVAAKPAAKKAPAKKAAPKAAVSSADAKRQKVVAAALSKVGSRYVYGKTGPSSFDCSGLTLYAYRQVGVSLPHSSRSQSRVGKRVALNALKPGDLVFYYSPISHVGIYIGNGKVVDAANRRTGVRVTSLKSMPLKVAVRVIN